MNDPDTLTISHVTRRYRLEYTLLDVVESIPLMPLYAYNILCLGETQQVDSILKFAYHTCQTKRIGRDILVNVDDLYCLFDFVILDMSDRSHKRKSVPIILGRKFLSTLQVNINCGIGDMDIKFGTMIISMNNFSPNQVIEPPQKVKAIIDAKNKVD